MHVDGTDPGIDVRGMVAADAASAVFTITQTETSVAYPRGAGPDARARPRPPLPGRASSRAASTANAGPVPARAGRTTTPILTGRELESVGLRPPVQFPQQATVVELTAEN